MKHDYVFLGLNVSRNQAVAEAARLQRQAEPGLGRSFRAVPVSYRSPSVDLSAALATARQVLEAQMEAHRDVTFEPIDRWLGMEHPMFYVFHTVGREWQAMGL